MKDCTFIHGRGGVAVPAPLYSESGVSVETTAEARAALRYPGVASIQIIFNMFRLKPAEEVFPPAQQQNVGILASGLLSGKMTRESASSRPTTTA